MTGTSEPVSEDILGHVTRLLHARGERMTVPRRSVLLALAARTGHVSAEQVVADVAALAPRVHRSSVYRTLDALTASAQDQFGFTLDPLHVALSGICRSCAHDHK